MLKDGEEIGANPITSLPYVFKAGGDGLHAGLPGPKHASASFVQVDFTDTIAFGASEDLNSHTVASFDALSVHVEWAAKEGGGKLSAPLVRGMPYVSADYDQLSPLLAFNTVTVVKANGKSLPATLTDDIITLEMSDNSLWQVYILATRKGCSWSIPADGKSLKGDGIFHGTIRAAAATENTKSVLDRYAKRVPVGAKVAGSSNGDMAHLEYEWQTVGEGELLMMALAHHVVQLPPSVAAEAQANPLVYNTMKGDMQAVVGDKWVLSERVLPLGFGASRPIADSRKAAVHSALLAEKDKAMLAIDPYGSGKEMAAVARLALIADELDEPKLASELRARVASKLESWLSGGGQDPLLYEKSYGGMVSTNGIKDRGADFGGGWYNDHHFHYGYFIYAAAVVAKDNKTFSDNWGSQVMHLVRDIANPAPEDKMYPYMRYKDWFVGHSWASGLFPSASSRNQESASEALNAWYGIALYGAATGDKRVERLGQLLLMTELRSTWTYYQIMDDSIYPQPFASNKQVGCLWSLKADFSTWFGDKVEYIYGIQMMPITPVSEMLLRPEWLQHAKDVWYPALKIEVEQWRAFFIMANAVLDTDAAWDDASKLTIFDAGNTKANTLYWIATRGSSTSYSPVSSPPLPTRTNSRSPPPVRAPTTSAPSAAPSASSSSSLSGIILWVAVVGAVGLIWTGARHLRSRAQTLPVPNGNSLPGDEIDYRPL